MNKKMILAGLQAIALVPALSFASEESATAKVTLPKLILTTPNTPKSSRLNKLWNAFWPAPQLVKPAPYTVTINLSKFNENTVSAIQAIDDARKDMVEKFINPNCSAKGTRLALGTIGYWLVKGYRSLNPKISFVNGLTQLYNKTSRTQKFKTLGLVAGTIAAAKWVAPFVIKQWQMFKINRQINAYEKKLSQAISNCLQILPGNYKDNYSTFQDKIRSLIASSHDNQATFNHVMPDQR